MNTLGEITLSEDRLTKIVKEYDEIITKWKLLNKNIYLQEAQSLAKSIFTKEINNIVNLGARYWAIKPMLKKVQLIVNQDLQLQSAVYCNERIIFPRVNNLTITQELKEKPILEQVYNFQTIQNIKF